MVTLRLFRQSDPFRQLEARELAQGDLAIGRDPGDGWTIPDPDRTISRRHLVVGSHDGRLTLRDTSANGVFVGAERVRAPADATIDIAPGETLRLGPYMIILDDSGASAAPPIGDPPLRAADDGDLAFDAPFRRPMLKGVEASEADVTIPSDWASPVQATPPPTDGSLLEAFCAGARLDASAFSGEDPIQVMHRLGAVYQQMVLGLGDLMSERTTVKNEYRMERTSVHAAGNNPFRWAPAQRVAVDVLHARDDGFLSGPEAVTASFSDLKKHLVCMLAGLRAALAATLESLGPDQIEERLKGQSFVLKNKAASAWSEYVRVYAEFRSEADDNPDSLINRQFRAAYERQLQELDRTDGGA